jgi:hypothetical protein
MKRQFELDRRRWLRNATLGALSGCVATPASEGRGFADEDQKERDRFLAGPGCPQLLKVSKQLKGFLNLSPGEPCKCECKVGGRTQTVFRANYRAILTFSTAKPCDETELEPLLQRGTELWLKGTLTLREEKCREANGPVLLGRNQGVYYIHRYRPNADVMTGPFCGTEGFLPTEKAGKRCCAPGHGLGSFCGEGFGKLKGWSLCVSYHSVMEGLSPRTVCSTTKLPVVMDLDGVLIGPCQEIK